jgi:hypothetical protein
MAENEKEPTDQAAGQGNPTAAQKALREHKALLVDTLVHGAYYNGLLGDTTMVARWHAHNRRFVFWEHEMGEPKLKAAPHVADVGTGAHFAPLSLQETEGKYHISDFALETTR